MPEDRRLVPDLTVEENVLTPVWATKQPNPQARLEWVYSLMPEVKGFASRRAMSLSGGQQKLAALARALMIGKKVSWLDEPFEGVAPTRCRRLVEGISSLKTEGISVLISESDYTHTRGVVAPTSSSAAASRRADGPLLNNEREKQCKRLELP